MICPHNYGRWYGEIITDVDAFQAYWKNLASLFKDNSKVVFDTNNECTYHLLFAITLSISLLLKSP
jgi:hypothetical protein